MGATAVGAALLLLLSLGLEGVSGGEFVFVAGRGG